MGLPGLAVAVCFATASTAFVVALAYTTVANILLMQAGVPLVAALIAWAVFRERVSLATWAAIAAVICGVGIMVSESFNGQVSPIGDSLALLISVMFSIATVITRRFAHVRMTPATCLGAILAASFAATQVGDLAVSPRDMGFLFAFGAINLGLGLAFFATGARLVPAAVAALLGTFEPILGPIWVWLDSRRGAVGAHHRRRRGGVLGAARPYRAGIQAPGSLGQAGAMAGIPSPH